jgi:parallel beta-helix repeat protein
MRAATATVLALWAPLAGAASYYVNDATSTGDVVPPGCASTTTGVDVAGCGGCLNPCRTPGYLYANTGLAPGDIVWMNAGTYLAPAGSLAPYLDLSNPVKAGTPGMPVTFRGVMNPNGSGPLTVFDGNGANMGANAGVRIATSWTSIEAVAITNTACPNVEPYGSPVFVAQVNIAGVTVVNVEVYGTHCPFAAPIDFEPSSTACTGCKIAGCRLHDNDGTGAGIWVNGTQDLEVRENTIYRNSLSDPTLPGIVLRGSVNTLVEGNAVYGNGGAALDLSRCAFSGICGTRDTSTTRIRQNTFWRNQVAGNGTAEIVLHQSSWVTLLENNLVGASRGACLDATNNVTIIASNYNDLFPTNGAAIGARGGMTSATLAAWQAATGFDLQSVSLDPLVGTTLDGGQDVHLQSVAGRPGAPGVRVFDAVSSPIIDLGNPASAWAAEVPPNGGRVNIGAYGGSAQASLTPVRITIVRGDPQSGPPGVVLPVPLEIEVSDVLGGRVEPLVPVTFVTSGGVLLFDAGTVTDANGRALVTAAPGPGTNTVRAALVGVGGATPAVFTLTGTVDAGAPDAGAADSGVVDSGTADSGVADSGTADSGLPDAGSFDAGVVDSGLVDSGVVDSGIADAGVVDSGVVDSGLPDSGASDAGLQSDGGFKPGLTIASAAPGQAHCQVPYRYAPQLDEGSGTWTLSGPEGATADPRTGAVEWTPTPLQSGPQTLTLTVSSGADVGEQMFTVQVSCPSSIGLGTCGCDAPGPGLLLLALLTLASRASSRRR